MVNIPLMYLIQISQGHGLDVVAQLYSTYVDSEALHRGRKEVDASFRKRLLDQYNKDFCEINC